MSSDKLTEMERIALKSQHEGHDPADARTVLVEELAGRMCDYCAHGDRRWMDRDGDGFWHADEFEYDASECEASRMLEAARAIGVPIYTGAELKFCDEDGAPCLLPVDGGGE